MLIVHREVAGLQSLQFIMRDSGVHWYETPKKDLVFLKNVSKNKVGFSKIRIKSAVKFRELQHILLFPIVKEVKWIIIGNHIQDFLVDKKDVYNAKRY